MMEVVVTAGAIKTCKAPVKSSPPKNEQPASYRQDALLVIQPTASKQASLFTKNNIMTILIQDVDNTMAGYQKEILPSSWSPIVKYSVYKINNEEKEALEANIKAG